MKLLKSLFSIITLTGCAVIIFLIRRKKFTYKDFTFRKTLKEKKNDSQDNNSKLDYCKIPELPEIPKLPDPKWVKIGRVQKLHMYPLNSGAKKSCSTLTFTDYGIITETKGFKFWDRMFRIYDSQTKQLQSRQNLEGMSLISVNVINKSKVRFCAAGMQDLTIDLDKETGKTSIWAEIKTNWIVVRYIDCGDVAAKWVNVCLRKSTLRLIRTEYDIIVEPKIHVDLLRNNLKAEALELLMTLTRYVMITSESLKNLHDKIPLKLSKIEPNIVISTLTSPAFEEDNWKWIKIGNIIMKKIMPVLSLKSIQNDDHKQPPFFGTFFETYVNGDMKVNDDVFVHINEPKNI